MKKKITSAAVAFAKRNPLIVYPALLALAMWSLMAVLTIKDLLRYYGSFDSYEYMVYMVIPLGIMFVLSLLIAYLTFLPGIIAWQRKHPSRVAVSWMCLLTLIPFLGWIFWIGLMFYAALSQTDRIAPIAYGEGSVVNGHVLRNNEWVRL